MGLFGNKSGGQALSQRDELMGKFNGARANLLLVVLFSVINLVLLVTNSDTYFLFSAFIPYFIGILAMDMCGKYPAEYYEGNMADYEFLGNGVFATLLAIAAVGIALYLICWFFSKKPRVGFLIFALVLFAIDTVGMFGLMGFSVDMIIDYVFHAWVIVSLISGISAYNKLKKLPPEEEAPAIEADDNAAEVTAVDATAADATEEDAQPEAAEEPKATLNGEPIE